MSYRKLKSVFVRTYNRYRFGQWESVCKHWRSHPGQYELFP